METSTERRIGGKYQCGTIFQYSPKSHSLKTIHEFTEGADGCAPAGLSVRVVRRPVASDAHATPQRFASVLQSAAIEGVLYGVTYGGGAGGRGTLFSIAPNGTFTTIHAFSWTDGAGPSADLTPDLDGKLYGTALYGGNGGGGTVFVLKPGNAFEVLHSFQAGPTLDGATPNAPITVGYNGSIYGTTGAGGDLDNDGTVFQMSRGRFSVIHRFRGAVVDGSGPNNKLVDGFDGYLYGSTEWTLFRIAK